MSIREPMGDFIVSDQDSAWKRHVAAIGEFHRPVVMGRNRAEVSRKSVIPWPELRHLTEMPFSDEKRDVSVLAQQLGQRDFGLGQPSCAILALPCVETEVRSVRWLALWLLDCVGVQSSADR